MNEYKILVVDDEDRIRGIIKDYITPQGFHIDESFDGKKALEMVSTNTYDLIILDVMMPGIDGWVVLKEIRKNTPDLPVIMLTAKGEEYDKLFGFDLGADDYVVKPFSPKELLARIKAVIKRAKPKNESDIFELNDLYINFDSQVVKIRDNELKLTPKEYDLLKFLIQNQNKVFSRDNLLNSVWGYDFYGDIRTVDTHIKMLRENLKEYRKCIVTVWGTGYKFQCSLG